MVVIDVRFIAYVNSRYFFPKTKIVNNVKFKLHKLLIYISLKL